MASKLDQRMQSERPGEEDLLEDQATNGSEDNSAPPASWWEEQRKRHGVLIPVLRMAASLKVTVVLFALAVLIVFIGTLAQTRYDIWIVVRDYFRTPIAWIDYRVFFPKSFFPTLKLGDPAYFPFPGGWLIGAGMAINLLAAHLVRFTMQARGSRLMTGLGVIGLGTLITGLVIAGGSSDGLQGLPFFEWSTLWTCIKLVLAGFCALGVWGYLQLDPSRKSERQMLLGGTIVLSLATAWLMVEGESVALGDASMRILWQLIQGGLAGGVLLVGCWLVFGKRAGIVLLHAGIGLLMFSELLVGTAAVESHMDIKEGDTVSFVQDIREVELAVVDASAADHDQQTVIPQALLEPKASAWWAKLFGGEQAAAEPARLKYDSLPFDIRVVSYLPNSDLRPAESKDTNPATKGIGRELVAEKRPVSVGASSSSAVDQPAIYVEPFRKGTDESLGTYLLSVMQSRFQYSRERAGLSAAEVRKLTGPFLARLSEPVTVEVDGKNYDLSLRFKRMYKPYSLRLDNVRTTFYPGTSTPKDYSSTVRVIDPTRDVDRTVRVWMNNPMRFAGETFYQINVMQDQLTGEEMTGLQVVTNTGWMIPYISCMIVGIGMLFQFCETLLRFLRRREAGRLTAPAARREAIVTPELAKQISPIERFFPAALVLSAAIFAIWWARPPKPQDGQIDLYAAGKIPVMFEGRIKPLDTLARNALQIISNKDAVTAPMDAETLSAKWDSVEKKLRKKWSALEGVDLQEFAGKPEKVGELVKLVEQKTSLPHNEVDDAVYEITGKRQPAIRWLLDVISGSEVAPKERIFRIENLDVLALFGLERRDGFRYSLAEIRPKIEEFNEAVDKVREKSRAQGMDALEPFERKLLELDRRVRTFTAIDATFGRPDFPAEPTDDIRAMARTRRDSILEQLQEAENRMTSKGHPPLVVPVRTPEGSDVKFQWKPYVAAWTKNYFVAKVFEEGESDPAVAGWDALLTAYKDHKPTQFNSAVAQYQRYLEQDGPRELNIEKSGFEAYFNYFDPFFLAWMLYIVGFVVAAAAWLGWSRPLNRAAFWLCVGTFALHTVALISRIYISGRPPVTNLYSSAVFIGWGCVALGLILEVMYKLGIGNVIAAIAGFATLFISFKLSGDGDTFTVMQAVLDTQFWLATHVTCITLGYATTFLSGSLGVLYVLRGVLTRSLTPEIGKSLERMIYGTLCFALFFSFVGTVLGGLWADDSWGRFWGWDPKENGALIIVLWNALVLHARWDGMVKDRGMAVLAVGGNIVTAWSWFGVNELGVGLHSYGFTEGVLLSLGIFAASQIAVMLVGLVPRQLWISRLAASPGQRA